MPAERTRLLTLLGEEFGRWKGLLSGLSEAQITASHLPNGWSIRNLTAHLMAWQQISIARLEAARLGREPALPEWLAGVDPDLEANLDRINARIYATYEEQPSSDIYQGWVGGISHFLALAAEILEGDLQDTEKLRVAVQVRPCGRDEGFVRAPSCRPPEVVTRLGASAGVWDQGIIR